jgi:hypothetical protein
MKIGLTGRSVRRSASIVVSHLVAAPNSQPPVGQVRDLVFRARVGGGDTAPAATIPDTSTATGVEPAR